MELSIVLCVLRKLAVDAMTAPVAWYYGIAHRAVVESIGLPDEPPDFEFTGYGDEAAGRRYEADMKSLDLVASAVAAFSTFCVAMAVAVFLAAETAWAVGLVQMAPGTNKGPLTFTTLFSLWALLIGMGSLPLVDFAAWLAGVARGASEVAQAFATHLRGLADQCRSERASR